MESREILSYKKSPSLALQAKTSEKINSFNEKLDLHNMHYTHLVSKKYFSMPDNCKLHFQFSIQCPVRIDFPRAF